MIDFLEYIFSFLPLPFASTLQMVYSQSVILLKSYNYLNCYLILFFHKETCLSSNLGPVFNNRVYSSASAILENESLK